MWQCVYLVMLSERSSVPYYMHANFNSANIGMHVDEHQREKRKCKTVMRRQGAGE